MPRIPPATTKSALQLQSVYEQGVAGAEELSKCVPPSLDHTVQGRKSQFAFPQVGEGGREAGGIGWKGGEWEGKDSFRGGQGCTFPAEGDARGCSRRYGEWTFFLPKNQVSATRVSIALPYGHQSNH